MEDDAGNGGSRKRMRASVSLFEFVIVLMMMILWWIRFLILSCEIWKDEEGKGDSRDGISLDNIENEGTETKLVASDEVELNIAQILDKIESFTQTVRCDNLPDCLSLERIWYGSSIDAFLR